MNACGKTNNKGIPPYGGDRFACTGSHCRPNPYGGGGSGGGIHTNILAKALGHIAGYGSVGLTLYSGVHGQQYNNGGSVSASGSFYADHAIARHTCALDGYGRRITVPPGAYQINRTLQPGSWDQSSVRQLKVQATGPTVLDLYFPSGGIYAAHPALSLPHTNEIFSNHMWGQVVIERVNGVPCQRLSFEME